MKKFTDKEIQKIADKIGKDFASDEREVSALHDLRNDYIFMETTDSYTAKRWLQWLNGFDDVIHDEKADSLKLKVPTKYCRKIDYVLAGKYRKK